MKNHLTRCFVAVGLGAAVCVGISAQSAREADASDKPKQNDAWQPPKVDHSAYRDIVDYNIFRADRRKLADQVDRDRNPPPPRDNTPREIPREVEKPPADPDSFWRLAGITHAPSGVIAFIEHTTTGDLTRLTGPGEFSKGEVTSIGYDAVVYVINDEQRTIRVGQTLLGERVTPAGSSSSGSSKSGSSSSSKSDLSPAERLRLLREQRAREQGETPPADPAPTPPTTESTDPSATPQTPADNNNNAAEPEPEPEPDAPPAGV